MKIKIATINGVEYVEQEAMTKLLEQLGDEINRLMLILKSSDNFRERALAFSEAFKQYQSGNGSWENVVEKCKALDEDRVEKR